MDPKVSTSVVGPEVDVATGVADAQEVNAVTSSTSSGITTDTTTSTEESSNGDEKKKRRVLAIMLGLILLVLLGLGYIGYTLYQESQVEQDDDIAVEVDEDMDEDDMVEEEEEVAEQSGDMPPVVSSQLKTYEYTFYSYDIGTENIIGKHDIKFLSSAQSIVVLKNGRDSTNSIEVAQLLLGSADTRIKFSLYYEGFHTQFQGIALTEVGNSSELGKIHRFVNDGHLSSALDTEYISGVTLTGSCQIMDQSILAPCGPAWLTYKEGNNSRQMWMSCGNDTDNALCDELVQNLEIKYTPVN